jgi:hypothetical protein
MPISPRGVLLAVLAAALVGCGSPPSSPTQPVPQPSSTGISDVARAYINEMVGLTQALSINRHRIDWAAFREAVFAAAPNAQRISDLYTTAIPAALDRPRRPPQFLRHGLDRRPARQHRRQHVADDRRRRLDPG